MRLSVNNRKIAQGFYRSIGVADIPADASLGQRARAARLTTWRNAGRTLVEKRLRRVARTHRLLSYDQAYDDIERLYGTRTRTLSAEGVLV
jgi:hypothetical protein